MKGTRLTLTGIAVTTLTVGLLGAVPPASAASYPCSTDQTLRRGQKNSCVKALQTYLNGYIGAGLALDGSFGPATLNAVIGFQAQKDIATDGVVGPITRTTICGSTGIPVNSGATEAQIVAAGDAVMQMCRGWGFVFD